MFILVFPSPFLTWHSHWSIEGAWNLFEKNVCRLIIISNRKLKGGKDQRSAVSASSPLQPVSTTALSTGQLPILQILASTFIFIFTQHMGSQFSHYVKILESALLKFENDPAAAAKSLQSCPTLCDPIDSSLPGSTVPGILQARTLEWVAISFSNA